MANLIIESFQTTTSPNEISFLSRMNRAKYYNHGRNETPIAYFEIASGLSPIVLDNDSGGLFIGFRAYPEHLSQESYGRPGGIKIYNATGEAFLRVITGGIRINGTDIPLARDAFIEFGMDDTYYELRIDGVTHTRIIHEFGSPVSCAFYSESSAWYNYYGFQDFYVNDKSGATNNNFWGDVKIDAYPVNGDGAINGFTSSSGSDTLFGDIQAMPADQSTYIEGVNIGSSAYFDVTDLEATESPLAVKVSGIASKMAATDSGIKLSVKSGDSETKSEKITLPVTGVNSVGYSMDSAPDGTPWTPAKANALQVGLEIVE